MKAQTGEFHLFEVDKHVVNDFIHSQNGTLSTALRELVMNAFDANSKSVEIIVQTDRFEVRDSGQGFEDKDAIMRNFKCFGTPHEAGDALYGRFRIGRGQIMGFGKITWHSNDFKMTTDIQSCGAGFHFEDSEVCVSGCVVSGVLYTPLKDYEKRGVISELTDLVLYAPSPVFINGIQVSRSELRDPDFEDDQIKVKYDPNGRHGVKLYSQGILVKTWSNYTYGFSADIVTKKALTLNMARNEVSDSDPLWRHVHDVLRAELARRRKHKVTLEEYERLAIIEQLRNGEVSFEEVMKLPLLKDCRGKPTSPWTQLYKKRPWSVAPSGQSIVADNIMGLGAAFVLTQDELSLWRVSTIEELFAVFVDAEKGEGSRRLMSLLDALTACDFQDLSAGISTDYELLALKTLSPLQRAQRNALQYVANILAKRISLASSRNVSKRKVHIGRCALAQAWTDSATYIAIDKKRLKLFESEPGLFVLTALLIHEYTHENGSVNTNVHGPEFYERFHDTVLAPALASDVMGNAVLSLRHKYIGELENMGLPAPKWLGRFSDRGIKFVLGSRRMTPILAWFIEMLGVVPETGNGWIEITLPGRYSVSEHVFRGLKNACKSVGITFIDEERNEEWKRATEEVISEMLKKYDLGHSELTASTLTRFFVGRYDNTSRFHDLDVLCSDPAFDVVGLERTTWRPMKYLAGKDFSVKLDSHDYDYRTHQDARSIASLSAASEARFALLNKAIQELISGVKNTKERSEFCRRLFNDDMARVFDDVE